MTDMISVYIAISLAVAYFVKVWKLVLSIEKLSEDSTRVGVIL